MTTLVTKRNTHVHRGGEDDQVIGMWLVFRSLSSLRESGYCRESIKDFELVVLFTLFLWKDLGPLVTLPPTVTQNVG